MTKDLNITRRHSEKLSVLVIDDESEIREVLKSFLEMMVLFNFIVEASDGVEALKKCQVQNFDIIITDLQMPKIKGIEFIESFKALERTKGLKKETPIIILSANVTGDEVQEALKMGVKHVLTKPCAAEDFMLKIQDVLRKECRHKLIIKNNFKKRQSSVD